MAPFDAAEIAAGDPALEGEPLLRPAFGLTAGREALTELGPGVIPHLKNITNVSLIERRPMSDNGQRAC